MTKEIQLAVGKNRVLAGHECVAENISYLLNHEMDVMSIRNGMLYEYEVKISRSDFAADKKKRKNQFNGINGQLVPQWNPNYFSYVCPEGMISKDEVPGFAGLYYYKDGKILVQKKPKLISSYQHSLNEVRRKIITVYQQRAFLGGVCLMTYKNRVITEANDKILNG